MVYFEAQEKGILFILSGVATAGHLGRMSQLKINNLPFLTLFFTSFALFSLSFTI
jgi:hypothetical protein